MPDRHRSSRGSRAPGRAARVVAAASGCTALLLGSVTAPAQPTQSPSVAAWRVECSGDGKQLDCRAVQQIFQRDTRQLVASLAVRYAPAAKATAMTMQLPLGLNLTEPVLVKVDSGQPERQSIQTCTNDGCFVVMALSDKFLASMRTGNELKITMQDASKKPVEVSLPLLGFGLAYDKAK
jgi:invasion protein IalB